MTVGTKTPKVGENIGAPEMPGNDVVRREREPKWGSASDTGEAVTLKRRRGQSSIHSGLAVYRFEYGYCRLTTWRSAANAPIKRGGGAAATEIPSVRHQQCLVRQRS